MAKISAANSRVSIGRADIQGWTGVTKLDRRRKRQCNMKQVERPGGYELPT
jgi:hypothetical protein